MTALNQNAPTAQAVQSIPAKIAAGETARRAWKKHLKPEGMTISKFNELCGQTFRKFGDIVLDDSKKRQTVIQLTNTHKEWTQKRELIYSIVRGDKIMKLGGTRTGLKDRWSSYKCGHCVPQRISKRGSPFPGKMSVTNAHLYHTIEDDLIKGGEWSIWCWVLPTMTIQVDILGVSTNVIAQTYHAYESVCIKKFKEHTGHIPQLCFNSDPNYK